MTSPLLLALAAYALDMPVKFTYDPYLGDFGELLSLETEYRPSKGLYLENRWWDPLERSEDCFALSFKLGLTVDASRLVLGLPLKIKPRGISLHQRIENQIEEHLHLLALTLGGQPEAQGRAALVYVAAAVGRERFLQASKGLDLGKVEQLKQTLVESPVSEGTAQLAVATLTGLTQELLRLKEYQQWQPIETAPKTGDLLLMATILESGIPSVIGVGKWGFQANRDLPNGGFDTWIFESETVVKNPTHWSSLLTEVSSW